MTGWSELLVVLLIVLLLFGATRIPQIARAMGQSVKEFKKASKDGSDDSKSSR